VPEAFAEDAAQLVGAEADAREGYGYSFFAAASSACFSSSGFFAVAAPGL